MIYDKALLDYRLPSADECELLMGIDKRYTLGAVKEKFDSRKTFVVRRQLIGNSFNCCVVSFLVSELLRVKFVVEPIPLSTHLHTITYELPFNEIFNSSQSLCSVPGVA